MKLYLFFVLPIAVVAAVYVVAALVVVRRLRGVRLVACPEAARPAAVTVAPRRLVANALGPSNDLKVSTCSRWPERAACNQACVGQVAIAPMETKVFAIVKRWYADKQCALCLRPIPMVQPNGPQPGLFDHKLTEPPTTIGWREVPADTLPALFETHLPVCARCHRREHFGMPGARRSARELRTAV